jgi:hypothetical protein
MYISIHVTYPLFSSDFHETEISLQFPKKINKSLISNFIKIPPLRAEVFRADVQKGGQIDRQTDRRDEASSRFSQFS